MRVEVHDKFQQPVRLPASRVVVYDEFDNPIAAVIQVDGGQYVAVTASHKLFHSVLKAMGIQRTVVVEHIDPKGIKPLRVD